MITRRVFVLITLSAFIGWANVVSVGTALAQVPSASNLVVPSEKMATIAKEIQLDKSQEKAFWQLYNNYQHDLQQLSEKRIRLIEDAKSQGPNLTDAQATELIRRALALEENRLAAKRRNVGMFLEKLPPRTVARYFQLENKIQTEVDAQIAERMPLLGQ